MAQPQIAANKTKALRIGQRLMTGAKSFGKGVRNSVDTSQQVITQSARKIKADQKRINTENKKQQRFEEAVREETERRQKSMFSGGYKLGDSSKKLVEKVLVNPLAAFWKIVGAWVIMNLPTIIEELRKFVKKVRIVVASINNALRATGNLFKGWLAIGQAWLTNMVTFDFGDSTGRLEKAQGEVDGAYDELSASWETIYNVWGKEEKELDDMLAWLDSGKTVKETADAITQGLPIPQTPAFGPGSREGGGGYGGQMSADEQQLTESLIAGEEGVRTKAYQDSEGIWTIGYGQTRINGRPVKPGDTISKAQALSGFRGALAEHQQRAINQLGEERWSQLDARSRAVLTSITYNYGSIPSRILPAAKTGSAEDIAVAMNSLYGDNGGDLKGRRQREQSILRGGTSSYLDKDFMAGGQFAGSGTGPLVMGSGNDAGPEIEGAGNVDYGQLSSVLTAKDFDTTDRSVASPIIKTSLRGQRNGRHHGGIDYAPPAGETGWYCAYNSNGRVTFVGSLGGYGKTVIIQFGGVELLFAHLARYAPGISRGASYSAGSPIGEIGSTGRSSGIHLHFEARPPGGGGGSDIPAQPYVGGLVFGRYSTRGGNSNIATPNTSVRSLADQLNITAASNRTNGNKNNTQTIIIREPTIVK